MGFKVPFAPNLIESFVCFLDFVLKICYVLYCEGRCSGKLLENI